MAKYRISRRRLKTIPDQLRDDIETEAKTVLHAGRDCLRNQRKDTLNISFSVNDGYYGEAFGIMRCLAVLGYGYFGSDNLPALREDPRAHRVNNVTQDIQNLKWWFSGITETVLEEEGWRGDHRCEWCLSRYKKDDASLIEKGLLTLPC